MKEYSLYSITKSRELTSNIIIFIYFFFFFETSPPPESGSFKIKKLHCRLFFIIYLLILKIMNFLFLKIILHFLFPPLSFSLQTLTFLATAIDRNSSFLLQFTLPFTLFVADSSFPHSLLSSDPSNARYLRFCSPIIGVSRSS